MPAKSAAHVPTKDLPSASALTLLQDAVLLADDEARRGRLLAGALLTFGSICGLYLLLAVLWDQHLLSPIALGSAFNTFSSLALYCYYRARPRELKRTAVLFAVQMDLAITFLSLAYAHPNADVTMWLVALPLYLLFVVGQQAGLVATLVIIPQAILIYIFHIFCDDGILNENEDLSGASFHLSTAGRGLNNVSFLLAVSSVCFAYEDARRVALASLHLVNDRLQQTTVAKAQFLANMTHELRTPMHAIISMAKELLESTQMDGKTREAVQIISDSSDHLLSLVNDILDYESVEAGQVVIESIPFSLHKEASKVVNLLAVLSHQKDILLDMHHLINHDMRVGDPLRFRQVLYNLLSNGIKFTPESGHVSLSVLTEPEEPDMVRIEVRDTGMGIDESHRESLFKVYSQSTPDIRRKFGGSGLGLAICKGLCEAMGGNISYTSAPGEGTTFTCLLRIPRSAREFDFEYSDDPTLEKESDDHLTCVLAGTKVLLVEDNRISQMVGVKLLTKLGLNVKVASDGQECLAIVQEEKFDAILMDCHMPNMDGFEATRMIRALEASGMIPYTPRRPRHASARPAQHSAASSAPTREGDLEYGKQRMDERDSGQDDDDDGDDDKAGNQQQPQMSRVAEWARPKPQLLGGLKAQGIPVIALTASTGPEIQRQCVQCGMNDFLRKPFHREELVQVLLEWAARDI